MRRRTHRVLALAIGLIVLGLLAGCGYRLAGSGGGVLPPHVKTIAVLPFDNRTTRTRIEQRVTEEVTRELSRRGGYRVVTTERGGDVELSGAVTSYRTAPVQFGSGGRASRIEAVVTIQATLRDLASDEILWRQDGLIFREQFDVPDTGEFIEQETVALDEIASGVAGVLVTSIIEGF